MSSEFFTIADLAERYGVGKSTIRQWRAAGTLPKPTWLSLRKPLFRKTDIIVNERRRRSDLGGIK